MPAATPVLKVEPKAKAEPAGEAVRSAPVAASPVTRRFPSAVTGVEQAQSQSSASARSKPLRENEHSFQARVPVIIGEATYRGLLPVDGIVSGQLGANGSALSIKQRPRRDPLDSVPELNGEITFKGMLRVNGHIAGKVFSFKGTLIVDASARVDASIDVAVAVISGTVNGDVVGHERVEVGPGAVVIGNITARSIAIKPGAVFQGACRMLKNENSDQ